MADNKDETKPELKDSFATPETKTEEPKDPKAGWLIVVPGSKLRPHP